MGATVFAVGFEKKTSNPQRYNWTATILRLNVSYARTAQQRAPATLVAGVCRTHPCSCLSHIQSATLCA
jgi:hypothetical protein